MTDGGGGSNWSCKKTRKAPVKSLLPTNQRPAFYMPDALLVAQKQCQFTVYYDQSIETWLRSSLEYISAFQAVEINKLPVQPV